MSKFVVVLISLLLFIVPTVSAQNQFIRTPDRNTLKPGSASSSAKNLLIQKRAKDKEKIENKIAGIKEKLKSFKDQKKATAAAKISDDLNKINKNQTEQMQKNLVVISNILTKLADRINKNSPDIKNPVKALNAVTSARQVISTASAAVTTQAGKDYTIQITTESRVKTDAKTQRDKLHTDLQTSRKAVIDAKQAVAKAIKTAKANTSSKPASVSAVGK